MTCEKRWSGWRDSNPRPLDPQDVGVGIIAGQRPLDPHDGRSSAVGPFTTARTVWSPRGPQSPGGIADSGRSSTQAAELKHRADAARPPPLRAAFGYPSRVAVMRTVSKFMTNEPPKSSIAAPMPSNSRSWTAGSSAVWSLRERSCSSHWSLW